MAADGNRRLGRIGDALGGAGSEDYAPQHVQQVVYTEHWGPGAVHDPAARALEDAARTATCDQLVEWVKRDARRHGYGQPYHLIITFDGDATTRCHFNVPWRPAGTLTQQVLGIGQLWWPDCATQTAE